jgi:3-hydroxyisobutyrate dehydrogenase-like beta-hydroxyacid dehydrogenase
MASHLLKAGYRLYVHNRTASRAQASVDAGAIYCDTPGEVAAKALFDKVAREGFEENGTQVVIKAYGSWQ